MPGSEGTNHGNLGGTWSGHGAVLVRRWGANAPHSPHAANASLNARSPGAPFSMAMMARRWLT